MLVSEKAVKSKMATSKATHQSNGVFVELMTPKGTVFSGRAAAVRFSPANTVVQLEPGDVSYFGLINSGELVLRIGNKFQFFALIRGSASIRERRLTVLAETITPVTSPFENCGNPICDCGAAIPDHLDAASRSNASAVFGPGRKRRLKSSVGTSVRARRWKKKGQQ